MLLYFTLIMFGCFISVIPCVWWLSPSDTRGVDAAFAASILTLCYVFGMAIIVGLYILGILDETTVFYL